MYPNIRELNVTAGAQGSYSLYGNAAPVFVSACNLRRHRDHRRRRHLLCLTAGLPADPRS